MAKRRDAGEGSVYPVCATKGPQHKQGNHKGCKIERWIGQVPDGYYASGKRKFARCSRPTKGEALVWVRKTLGADLIPDRSTTMAKFLENWLESGLRDGLAEGTHRVYASVVRRWLVPYVGDVKLCALAPAHVTKLLKALDAKGLGPASRKQARAILVRSLKWAEANEWVARNVAAIVDGPRGSKLAKTDDALSRAQALTVLDTAADDRFEAAAVINLKVGLRIGEVCALRWSDIDFDADEIDITDGKTESSAGTVPMLSDVRAALLRRRERQQDEREKAGAAWVETGHVFTDARGCSVSTSVMRAWWHRLCQRAEVGHHRFHAGRHTVATLLLEDGVPLEVVSAVLRHKSLAITNDVYARVGKDAKRRALRSLDPTAARDAAILTLRTAGADAAVIEQIEQTFALVAVA